MVFWLAMFGMVCWGIAPVFAKVGLNNMDPLPGLIIRTLTASIFALGSMGFDGNIGKMKSVSFITWVFITIEALLATFIGDLAYYAAIKKGDISVVTVIMSSSPLVTMLVAIIFLGEQITMIRIVGAGLVVVGIMLIM
ncbi:MAG: EamA family transporter [Natronincolaceae bacterium]|jgi:transporter family protein|nr:EamA family transporter [Bacillota bacterium]NLK90649.1 EamA family transporter [Clostridiales bacterium]